jgi:HEPN domain-containing protein
MDDAKRELVCAWLIKARNDLDTARQISAVPAGHLDNAIYHCQQAAEKAVKGYLAFRDHRLERTHDVERLVALASSYEHGFDVLEDAAITLTPYATAYRYPGETAELQPSRGEFDEALEAASHVLCLVLAMLPEEVRPT